MKIVITGAAGFIGSHLARYMSTTGHDVVGIDSFTGYYAREVKERNVGNALNGAEWAFAERDAGSLDAADLAGVDVVVHLAAQPGVRASWTDFGTYLQLNMQDSNTLARAIVEAGVPRVVFASSSSVYGDGVEYPTRESSPTTPRSPYGVTKLAGESLWEAYTLANDLTAVALRFFTVYGPSQRPDMATQRLVRSAIDGSEFTLFGDGLQRRDFTFVDDVVRACASACTSPMPARMNRVNVGGSGDTSMNELIGLVEDAVGKRVNLVRAGAQVGDVLRTGADGNTAKELLGWTPQIRIAEGVSKQVAYELNPRVETWTSV